MQVIWQRWSLQVIWQGCILKAESSSKLLPLSLSRIWREGGVNLKKSFFRETHGAAFKHRDRSFAAISIENLRA